MPSAPPPPRPLAPTAGRLVETSLIRASLFFFIVVPPCLIGPPSSSSSPRPRSPRSVLLPRRLPLHVSFAAHISLEESLWSSDRFARPLESNASSPSFRSDPTRSAHRRGAYLTTLRRHTPHNRQSGTNYNYLALVRGRHTSCVAPGIPSSSCCSHPLP